MRSFVNLEIIDISTLANKKFSKLNLCLNLQCVRNLLLDVIKEALPVMSTYHICLTKFSLWHRLTY